MKSLALWKQQDVPFIKKVLELIRKYTKEAIRKGAIAYEKSHSRMQIRSTAISSSAPPLSYMITHKDVVSGISHSMIGLTDYIISVDYTCSFLNLKLVWTRKLNLCASWSIYSHVVWFDENIVNNIICI